MILHQISTLSQLACRELRSVNISHPMQLRCVEGTVWVTQHGEVEDLVVQQGTCVTLGKQGVVVLQALKTRAVYSLVPRINETDTAEPCGCFWPIAAPHLSPTCTPGWIRQQRHTRQRPAGKPSAPEGAGIPRPSIFGEVTGKALLDGVVGAAAGAGASFGVEEACVEATPALPNPN